MSGERQNNQLELAFLEESRGEAPMASGQGTEPPAEERRTEDPASTEHLMEEVCQRENLEKALKRVQANKGGPGINDMTVEELPDYLKEHWPDIREQLLGDTYQPQPVKRVEIPKPGGGMRKLGIPTVLDRFIQQAILQVLQPRWDPTFSDHSYGFRPGRRAHQAVARAQQYIAEGYRWVVDIDLEKFFDMVSHDWLVGRVARRMEDKRLIRLVRRYLRAGVMEDGLVSPTDEGTPQGGPLSPLLSNLVLDELDQELEKRGHRFVRYADDCNIYVHSERAGHRVMESITKFIMKKLKLRVNVSKSAVGRPWKRKFLGFSFTNGKEPKRRISPEAQKKFKKRVKELTSRNRGVSTEKMVADLARYLNGWIGYFGYCQTPYVLRDMDSWIRRRLRCAIWKQWKKPGRRRTELVRRGVSQGRARNTAGTRGIWHVSRSTALNVALPNDFIRSLGLPSLKDSLFE